ncbi:uncharacterized protein [Rutidosis leptorrhynchoides]|uniref:uncharacterized protein n=1 Tax=Rutidosis leptorrhynchoides TaxID=125765 RepID=UPI003A996799
MEYVPEIMLTEDTTPIYDTDGGEEDDDVENIIPDEEFGGYSIHIKDLPNEDDVQAEELDEASMLHEFKQAEFAFNRSVDLTMGKSPFETVYGDGIEQAEYFRDRHQQVPNRIEQQNRSYKKNTDEHRKRVSFNIGDDFDSRTSLLEEGEDDAYTVDDSRRIKNGVG